MRKLMILVGALLAAHVVLLFVRPASVGRAASTDAVKVGIVLDVGGLGDKSFNDGAYRGAQLAEQKLGATIRLIEPGEGDRPRGRPPRARRRAHGSRDRRRLHLHRRHHAARQGVPERRTSPTSTTRSPRTRRARHPAARRTSRRSSSRKKKARSSSARSRRWSGTRRRSASWAGWTCRSSRSSRPATRPA